MGQFSDEYYNHTGADELMHRLADGFLLTQGPMGSALMSQYGAGDVPPAFWNIGEPQTVTNLHELYAAAGAQVLITNTFQANETTLKRDGIAPSVAEVNRFAVDDARRANPQCLLGSMGPAGIEWFVTSDKEYSEAREVYRNQAYALLNAGVDALLLETFTSIRDLEPALAGANDVRFDMPLLVSFAVDDEGNLLSDGLNIEAAVVFAEKHGASAVGVNCCSLAASASLVERMCSAATTPVMMRPNAGNPKQIDGELVWDENSGAFAQACLEWKRLGARVIGSCCGTTAKTTAAMAEALGVLEA